jgi:hypothetical protein
LLDQRYKALIAGKSRKLYWTWENEINWLPNFRDMIFPVSLIFFFVLFFCFPLTIAYINLQYGVFGVETQATVNSCDYHRGTYRYGGGGYRLSYTYQVNNISYIDTDSISSEEACNQLLAERTIRIQYLSNMPHLSVYQLDYNEWFVPNIATIGVTFIAILLSITLFGFYKYEKNSFLDFFNAPKNQLNRWSEKLRNDLSKFKRLEKEGILVDGEVTWVYFAYASNPFVPLQNSRQKNREKKIVLQAHYSFVSPSGKTIKGSRMLHSPNTKKAMLPKAGTSVNILYVDDDCHLLL